MGVEIECIIENHFSKSEIVELPTMIENNWNDLREFIEEVSKEFLTPITKSYLNKKARWDFDHLSEEEIENYWRYLEGANFISFHPKNNIWFFCYFGMIKIYRKVIVINPFSLRFKAFWNEDEAKNALVRIVRRIVNLFGAKKVLYCADSATKTEVLYNMAMNGNSLQEIIEFGELEFGKPNSNYLIGIDETYFIDDFNFEL